MIQARRKPTRAVCSGWSYPIQAELSLVLGGVPVLPILRVPPVAQVCRVDGKFGRSLVCIGGVLSLAVVPTALQKLHKCVTQNTTELLQDTRHKMFFKTQILKTEWASVDSRCAKVHQQTLTAAASAQDASLLRVNNRQTEGRKCFCFVHL